MERQTGLETAHYGRRMREECGGSALPDTINIGSDRIGSAGKAGQGSRHPAIPTEQQRSMGDREKETKGAEDGQTRVGANVQPGSKDESMNETGGQQCRE